MHTEGQKTLPCIRDTAVILLRLGLPGGSAAKNLPAHARDVGDPSSIPGWGGSLGGGHGFPLQYSCLENNLAALGELLNFSHPCLQKDHEEPSCKIVTRIK